MYEQFFGLADAPFRLTPDPHYLYLSPKHAEALAHLRLGLTEPGGFVCITGDIGTGKTTLLRTFLADLGPEVSTAYIFNPTLASQELLQRITRELGVPTAGDSQVDLLDALNAHLLAQRKAGRLSIVVIDEAQALSVDVLEQLRLLSNLETSTEKLLRLVLVGQPQLATLLLLPSLAQLNQRITLRWHLGPLTHAETVGYVRHRLGVASAGKAKHLFTAPALLLVHRFSKGVPRLVNMVAHRALLAAFVRRRRRVTARFVLRAYREIGAVPLRTVSPVRRAGLAVATAVGIALLALGAPPLSRRLQGTATLPAPAVHDTVATRPEAPAEPRKALASEAPPRPGLSATELERRLARLDGSHSARAAIDTLLAAWRVPPLRAEEKPAPDDLAHIALQRGLDDLRLTGNLSMLRLLDLPALLELRVPGGSEPRYVMLAGTDDQHVVLSIDGRSEPIDTALLDRLWFGEAHVLWRDFEGLGPTFGTEARGAQVSRLQQLLARVGAYGGVPTGNFDGATEAAVLAFQRSRLLVPDCRVGRLTRIVLYAAAGGYQRPTLATASGAAS